MKLKDIKGYQGIYGVSNTGIVYSIKRQRVLRFDKSSGYSRVVLQKNKTKKRFLVHRLVALHFVDGYFEEAIVNHIDGNKLNNHYSNLEWCNQSHNLLESIHNTKTRDTATKCIQKNNKSGYTGVRKQDNVYCVQIRHKGKTIHTKYGFKTAYEGAKYRDKYLENNSLPHTRSL